MKQSVNYLDKVPARNEKFKWSQNDAGIVTIEVPNRGVFHFLAQKLLKKPPIFSTILLTSIFLLPQGFVVLFHNFSYYDYCF